MAASVCPFFDASGPESKIKSRHQRANRKQSKAKSNDFDAQSDFCEHFVTKKLILWNHSYLKIKVCFNQRSIFIPEREATYVHVSIEFSYTVQNHSA